jgi:HAE1 family hydrophobic/amphiphilic exporter-1/multidrug efflux pump
MRLWIDPIKLASYGLTVASKNRLGKQNVELPSGKLTGANTELTVKPVGNLSTAEEFNNIIIRSEGGKNVRLSDIGSAVLGPENIETKLSQSGYL